MNTLISKILKDVNYKNNPYFQNLTNGNFDKEDFCETQIQFYFAVVFFSRPMAALAAKIPIPELRLEIIRNVWEEHGEGILTKIHGHTFLEFLKRLSNFGKNDIEKRALWPEVRIFNTTLIGACVLDHFLIGVAVMGIIERIFCDISAILAKEVINNGWMNPSQMIHYNLHEDLDIKHSQDFFNVLAQFWEINEENKYYIEQGFRLGATLFNGLYEGLYKSRKNRLFRQYIGPHSKIDDPV